ELDRIDLELSIIVAEDISHWSFADLHTRAERAVSAARDSLERGRARMLLGKIARFDDIKRRHDELRTAAVSAAGRQALGGQSPRRMDDPRFDGVGRLTGVVSQKTGSPQYALVDAGNNVLSFVTPAPGVNLRPFLDKYVGVNGQRGYLTDLQRQHIS